MVIVPSATHTSQDTIGDDSHGGQRTFADVLWIGAETVPTLVGSLPAPDARVAEEAVDNFFNAAEQVLAIQRDFARAW